MLRFPFRLMAMVALSVAVIMAVLDATRSIAASALVMTPLSTSWMDASPDTFSVVQSFLIEKVHPLAWDPVAVLILRQPGFAVFAVIAFLLHAIGHRPRRHARRLARI